MPLGPQDLAVDVGSNDGTLLATFSAVGTGYWASSPARWGTWQTSAASRPPSAFSIAPWPNRPAGSTARPKSSPRPTSSPISNTSTRSWKVSCCSGGEERFCHRIALPAGPRGNASVRHYLPRTSPLLLVAKPSISPQDARPGGDPRPAHSHPWRLHPRLCRAHRGVSHPAVGGGHACGGRPRLDLDSATPGASRHRVFTPSWTCMACWARSGSRGQRVYGIGAPSRASTLINYMGLDDGILTACWKSGARSRSASTCPGPLIPVLEESRLYRISRSTLCCFPGTLPMS